MFLAAAFAPPPFLGVSSLDSGVLRDALFLVPLPPRRLIMAGFRVAVFEQAL
jgi:hypothetical protein